MKIIDKLNKRVKPLNYKKTHIYRHILKNDELLDEVDVDSRPSDEIDLFYLEVLVNALLNRKAIIDAFDEFKCEDGGDMYDMLEYGERQRLFNQDIKPLLERLPHFKTNAGDSIYIPCFNPEINTWYRNDIQRVFLNQHKNIIEKQDIFLDTPEDIYGMSIFKTDFSSLLNVYETKEITVYYSVEFSTLYFFDRPHKRFLYVLRVEGEKTTEKITGKDLQVLAILCIEENYGDLLDYMVGRTFIEEKLYKKLIKLV